MVVRLILAEFHSVIIDSSNVLYRLLDFAFATYICASTGSTVNVVNIQLISTMSSASAIIVELVTNEERRSSRGTPLDIFMCVLYATEIAVTIKVYFYAFMGKLKVKKCA